ncbi:MAG: Septum site-determining protein MinD [Syntrophomonadaceae bacterium]|nr:Septum site-determining protein MinD [Bacillota bacterium]
MPYTIAIAGKGGTGKTTLSALIISSLLRAGRKPILAVDADPNSNLNSALGIKYDRTVVSTVDKIMNKKEELSPGLTKERLLELHFQDAVVESQGFDLLVMGHTEGPGCYCHANNLLRGLMDKLKKNYPYIVMDNEAGMEHLSRRTTRDADLLFIIANPNPVSLRSARNIFKMTEKLNLSIKKSYLVLNQIIPLNPPLQKGEEGGFSLDLSSPYVAGGNPEEASLPLLGKIPYDKDVERYSMEGLSFLDLPPDSPAFQAVKDILSSFLP